MMELSDQPAVLSQTSLVLLDLEQKLDQLSPSDRELILPEITRLRACLDTTTQSLQESQSVLAKNLERAQILADHNPLCIWIAGVDGRNEFINRAYREYLGVTIEDVRGLGWVQFLHPEDAPSYTAGFQRAVQDQAEFHGEVRVRRPDGSWAWVFSHTRPHFSPDGRLLGFVGNSMDITRRILAEKALQEKQLRMELQRCLIEYHEKKRNEIARDLHDGPIQFLSATVFHLQVAKEVVQDPLIRLEIEQAAMNIKGAVRELRDIMNELRPPAIIQFGLAKTARFYAETFRERHPELKISLKLFDDRDFLPVPVRLALFRIFQESLSNIARHANASKVWISLLKKKNKVSLKIRDNGKGFDVPTDFTNQAQRGRYGLAGMQERSEAIGAEFLVSSTPGKGTTNLVVVTLPDTAKMESA